MTPNRGFECNRGFINSNVTPLPKSDIFVPNAKAVEVVRRRTVALVRDRLGWG
jgi:hypothetical protein